MDIKNDSFIKFAQEAFSSAPKAFEGDAIICPMCRQGHRLVTTNVTYLDDDGQTVKGPTKTDAALFYVCKSGSYLGAVCNHLVDNIELAPNGTFVC